MSDEVRKKKKRQDKKTSSKRANIHNRWWRERSERNLRIFTAKPSRRPRRGRTQASCKYTPICSPSSRTIFPSFMGPQASLPSAAQPAVMDIRRLRRRLLEINVHNKHAKVLLCFSPPSCSGKRQSRASATLTCLR